jgi:hypothetical protein
MYKKYFRRSFYEIQLRRLEIYGGSVAIGRGVGPLP